jgi:hypothetical protein
MELAWPRPEAESVRAELGIGLWQTLSHGGLARWSVDVCSLTWRPVLAERWHDRPYIIDWAKPGSVACRLMQDGTKMAG